jgi:hypothetical protein
MIAKLHGYGILAEYNSGTIELYKNGHLIRQKSFTQSLKRKSIMEEMLLNCNVHLNNYYFIVKLND